MLCNFLIKSLDQYAIEFLEIFKYIIVDTGNFMSNHL